MFPSRNSLLPRCRARAQLSRESQPLQQGWRVSSRAAMMDEEENEEERLKRAVSSTQGLCQSPELLISPWHPHWEPELC